MLGFFMQGSPARFFTDYPTLLAKRASNLFPSPFPIVEPTEKVKNVKWLNR